MLWESRWQTKSFIIILNCFLNICLCVHMCLSACVMLHMHVEGKGKFAKAICLSFFHSVGPGDRTWNITVSKCLASLSHPTSPILIFFPFSFLFYFFKELHIPQTQHVPRMTLNSYSCFYLLKAGITSVHYPFNPGLHSWQANTLSTEMHPQDTPPHTLFCVRQGFTIQSRLVLNSLTLVGFKFVIPLSQTSKCQGL